MLGKTQWVNREGSLGFSVRINLGVAWPGSAILRAGGPNCLVQEGHSARSARGHFVLPSSATLVVSGGSPWMDCFSLIGWPGRLLWVAWVVTFSGPGSTIWVVKEDHFVWLRKGNLGWTGASFWLGHECHFGWPALGSMGYLGWMISESPEGVAGGCHFGWPGRSTFGDLGEAFLTDQRGTTWVAWYSHCNGACEVYLGW